MNKVFNLIFEIIGWFLIVASPVFAGSLIGALIYFRGPDRTGLIILVSLTGVGVITGIIWASRIWRKTGTINYLSRIISSSDLDNNKENENKITNNNRE
jgi:hypothetical protein